MSQIVKSTTMTLNTAISCFFGIIGQSAVSSIVKRKRERPAGFAGAFLSGGAAFISDATRCQATSAQSKQYAEQQDDRWSIR